MSATEQHSARIQQLRYDFRHWSLSIDPRNLVFVDEAGVNLGMSRLVGRAPIGERVHDQRPRNTGQNLSLLGALSSNGLMATMSIPGSVNTDVFVTYLSEVLLPQLWAGAIVVMDNLPVHHAHRVRHVIENSGVHFVFLPPYSPDLSPIELCWSKLKQWLRSAKARTVNALDHALTDIVTQLLDTDDAVGWFAHCGLFI